MRILLLGHPGSGKSTVAAELAKELDLTHLCTDPQPMCPEGVQGTPEGLAWSEQSQYVADEWLGRPNTIIEGVALLRALRKWRRANPTSPPPCEKVLKLETQFKEPTKAQAGMRKALETDYQNMKEWLCPQS